MSNNPTKGRSALAYLLGQEGTAASFQTMSRAVQSLSKVEICDLEEELNFYSETGLIGVQMSRLLNGLCLKSPTEAA